MERITFKKITDENECIRLLTEFRLCLKSLKEDKDINFFAKKFTSYAEVVVVNDENGKNIGFIAYYANKPEFKIVFITMIAILPEYRRLHIGQKLIDYCRNDAIDRGYKFIRLEVDKENEIAKAFYKKNKFYCLDGNDKILMEMAID